VRAAAEPEPQVPGDPYAHPITECCATSSGWKKAEELAAAEREITHAALILCEAGRSGQSLLADIRAQIIADAVGVPLGACEQVLHPVRCGMPGDCPAVLGRQFRQQAQHERSGPVPWLHLAETSPGPGHQLIEYLQPAARVYAAQRSAEDHYQSSQTG